MKIIEQRNGKLNEQDRLQLATLLIKAGYSVKIGKDKIPGKTTNIIYVEFTEQKDLEQ